MSIQDPTAATWAYIAGQQPLAYSVADLSGRPLSQAQLYIEIRAGRLKARKFGVRTIILHQDWVEFLRSLPVAGRDAPPLREPESLRKSRLARKLAELVDTTATRIA